MFSSLLFFFIEKTCSYLRRHYCNTDESIKSFLYNSTIISFSHLHLDSTFRFEQNKECIGFIGSTWFSI